MIMREVKLLEADTNRPLIRARRDKVSAAKGWEEIVERDFIR